MVPAMPQESDPRGAGQPNRRQSQLREALHANNSPGQLREALDANDGRWPQTEMTTNAAAPGQRDNRSLIGLIIREIRSAPQPVRGWLGVVSAGVITTVIGGLIVAFLTRR
jgi:hypothetical protein